MIYSIIEYKIGVLAMSDSSIMQKLKLDIEERERSYQKELEKIKKEKNLLNYIKGMLDITEESVTNFPYYDGRNKEQEEAEEDFNVMLKYTLKEDKIIASFKSEIKNLYYLEKIGYQHAEQYQETKKKLEEYRQKIKEAYQELIENETLKKAITNKEQILIKLDTLKEQLEEKSAGEIDDVDGFYEELQYANLSESEKTAILISILKRNLKLQLDYLNELKEADGTRDELVDRAICVMTEKELETLKRLLLNRKLLNEKLRIRITYPTAFENIFSIEQRLAELQKEIKEQVRKNIQMKNAEKEEKQIEKFLFIE